MFVAQTPRRKRPLPIAAGRRAGNLDKEGLPTLMRKAAIRAGLVEA